MDREIYKQRFMEADSSRMPVSEFQKIINDSIYPATGSQRGYNNLLIHHDSDALFLFVWIVNIVLFNFS